MAAVKKGVIIWRGDSGRPEANMSRSIVKNVSSEILLDGFLTFMETHTLCNVAGHSFNSKTTDNLFPPGADANVDVKATVYMKDPSDDSMVRFSYPAPTSIDFEEKSQGTRMTEVALTAFMTAFNTMLGLSGEDVYVGLWGTLTQTS